MDDTLTNLSLLDQNGRAFKISEADNGPITLTRYKSRLRFNLVSLGHRTHKQFEYRQLVSFGVAILISIILLLSPINSLDSPTKIQRHKQQAVDLKKAQPTENVQALSDQPQSSSSSTNTSRIERVRRTDASSNAGHKSPEQEACPPSELLHSLLPPEYAGSPASSQRQHMSRAYCDCTPDLFGWQLTCFAGSAARSSGAGASLPNQLHPAFRAPQLQRQQQQAAAAGLRRVHRSPARSSGEPEGAHSTDDPSAYEGFGDETLPSATTSKPDNEQKHGSRASHLKQRQKQASEQVIASSNETLDDGLISLSSSNSFTLMHLQQQDGQLDEQAAGSRMMMSEKLLQQSAPSNSQLMFQTVPVLFSIKCKRNVKMIEIDCDQAAPNYKTRMFQGFHVDEINSFTFNNCQLPSIPFSVLLHRTRSSTAFSSNGQQADQANNLRQNVKPLSRQRHQNLVRKRRELDSELEPDIELGFEESKAQGSVAANETNVKPRSTAQQQDSSGAINSSNQFNEPKIEKLTIYLNTVVEQRTLISLLTGLDLLKELQLYNMQLNLTNFEPDLEADPTSSATTSTETNASSQQAASSTRKGAGQVAPPSGADQQPTTGSTASSQQTAPLTQSISSTSSISSSSTTMAPTTQLVSATRTQAPPTSGRADTPPAVTTQAAGSVTTKPASSATPTTTAATVTTTTTTTSTTTTTGKPTTRLKQQVKPVQLGGSTITRPSISMGAPRGLMYAQATGVPTGQASAQTTTTQMPPATTVPSLSASSASPQQQQQPTTTSRFVPNNNLISVGASQSQSVSYTSSASPAQQQQRAQTAPASQPATSSSLIGGGGGGSPQLLAPNRLHQKPSAWFQANTLTTPANPPAGSRLMLLEGGAATPSSAWQLSAPATNPSPLNTPINAPLAVPAPLHSSGGFGIRTSASSSAPLPLSLNIYNTNSGLRPTTGSQSVGLNQRQTNQFTPTAAASTTTSQTISANQQTRRQQATASDGQFVAAGGRLSQPANSNPRNVQNNRPATTMAANQRAFQTSPDQMVGSNQMDQSDAKLALDSMGPNAPADHTPTYTLTAGSRFKRYASTADEFELSFGELLPELRYLKLVSFIDLSHLSPKLSSAVNARFKRQFQASDLPEKDDSHMTDSDSNVLSNKPDDDDDSMIAEESSVHHNSVMANSEPVRIRSAGTRMVTPMRDFDRAEPEAGDLLIRSTSALNDDSNASASASDEQPADLSQASRYLSLVLIKMFSRLNKLEILQLRSNNIPVWPDNVVFESRNSLKRLYLISNNIKQLGKNSLANLTKLEILDLTSNQLRQLNADLFRDLSGLQHLRACQNLFRRLPSKLFAQMSLKSEDGLQILNNKGQLASMRLVNVDFSKNRFLSQLSADMFAVQRGTSLATINSLNLSNCIFTDQLAGKSPEQALQIFSSLPDLINVSLKHNKLRELLTVSGLFAKNNRLQKLDLSHNQLILLSSSLFNGNASQINELHLNHNQLSQIPNQFLFNLRQLRKLSLSHNKLTQLNPNLFTTNPLLEFIDLSHNQLISLNTQKSDRIPFGLGGRLRSLNLAHNNLSQFEEDVFEVAWHIYGHLSQLDLSNNQFAGQISMPIFITIENELELNLASNSIQSVNVDELMQSEQVIMADPTAHSLETSNNNHQQHQFQAKQPVVRIKLSNNPLACDCMLVPLVNYSRQVAAASNPTLMASILPPLSNRAAQSEGAMPASSRYSVASGSNQMQLVYQFEFNDLRCASPANLKRQQISHLSIYDLLCPIKDERLCPSKCQCSYQSAFKTALVDCNNRQLTSVPKQLTDSANFMHFNVEQSFTSANKSIESVDKVIIWLNNNRLKSMHELASLFNIVNTEPSLISNNINELQRSRFARAPSRSSPVATAAAFEQPLITPHLFEEPSAQPLISSGAGEAPSRKPAVASPVAIGRNNWRSRARTRRQVNEDEISRESMDLSNSENIDSDLSSTMAANSLHFHSQADRAALEREQKFIHKRYPLSFELHLDHNLIEQIPESFLRGLDSVASSALQLTQAAPQAALPTEMLEHPVHEKLEHPIVDADPMRTSATTTSTDSSVLISDSLQAERLFGNVREPLSPEKKAALRDTINKNMQLNLQLNEQQQETKKSLSPSLVKLSLRYNNLSAINATMLARLSKLIKSSNTTLYLGHNPFNCSNNWAIASEADSSNSLIEGSPISDQLISASDESSGAYLEKTPDDLSASASSSDATLGGPNGALSPLLPSDCPIGQLKSWLTRYRANIADLDELYCVHMPPELAQKLRLLSNSSSAPEWLATPTSERTNWPGEHWSSAANSNGSRLEKNGVSWNSELLIGSAKIIDANIYDLCPYSGATILDASASGLLSPTHQQVLLSVAIIFILISLCLLLMLVYFGDTQTILAFVYIHMNPIYSCLRLNESHLDGEKLYDAFVSYSSADRDIVMELMERLERLEQHEQANNESALSKQVSAISSSSTLNRRTNSFQDLSTMSRSSSRIMMGANSTEHISGSEAQEKRAGAYRLCVHERDWLPGHLISWNIVNSVQNSRRTILILSKEFIKSVWFQVEFHTAYYQMLEDKIDRLIVIVRGELPPKNELDKNLAFLLTTKTYLTWGEKWFWERLHYALPHPPAPPELNRKLKQQQQHRHQYAPKQLGAADSKPLGVALGAAKSGGSGNSGKSGSEKALIMSSIGKDCSNLLLPVHHNHGHAHPPAAMIGSASSSGSSTSNGRSSFLSGSSTGNLLSPGATATTTNDLLSTSTPNQTAATTTLTIGPAAGLTDSGRGTTMSSGAMGAAVTSIVLDGHQQQQAPVSSRMRAIKQDRLQSFVEQKISNHLSEL